MDCFVAPNRSPRSQAASDSDLHCSLSQEAPEPTPPGAHFRSHRSTTQLAPQQARPKEDLSMHQTMLGWILLRCFSPCTATCTVVRVDFQNQSAWQSVPPRDGLTAIKTQLLPRPGGSVGCSVVLYTKSLQVQFLVRVCTGGNQSTFLSYIHVCVSLSLPFSLKSIKHILRWELFLKYIFFKKTTTTGDFTYPQKGHSYSTQLSWTGRLCYWVPQNTYQDWKS